MQKISGLFTPAMLITIITLLGGCGGEDNKVYTGTVSTIAGMATVSGVADGSGTLARFNLPSSITAYGTNLYIADSSNDTIRKVDISASGIPVTTLAGMAGSPGSTNGLGTAARFFNPSGITTDGTDLYVADTFNHTIRQLDISVSGVPVTTLAGSAGSFGTTDGTGAAARFNTPFGIVRNGADLYVADTASHTIRKITIGGVVTTIAGTANTAGSSDNPVGTSALFRSPSGITTDGLSLYVADTGNHTIRRIDISVSGIPPVTTIAGDTGALTPTPGSADGTDSSARFNSPLGIVRDGPNLYVADSGNHTIRQIAIATHVVTTLAGAAGSSGSTDGTKSAARFNFPAGITTDGTSLYVTDTYNHTIRRIQ